MKVKHGMQTKEFGENGTAIISLATLSAIDDDGDTYMPGAFGEQWAAIIPSHEWRHLPLGKGRVFEEGDEALADLKFNLDVQAGRDWHSALKFDFDSANGESVQQYSYGYDVVDSQKTVRGGENVRVINKTKVYEISPVLVGAGVNARTLAVKALSAPLADRIGAAASEVKAMAQAIADQGDDADPETVAEFTKIAEATNAFTKAVNATFELVDGRLRVWAGAGDGEVAVCPECGQRAGRDSDGKAALCSECSKHAEEVGEHAKGRDADQVAAMMISDTLRKSPHARAAVERSKLGN